MVEQVAKKRLMESHPHILNPDHTSRPGVGLRPRGAAMRKAFSVLQAYRFVLAYRQAEREKKLDADLVARGAKKPHDESGGKPGRGVVLMGAKKDKRRDFEKKVAEGRAAGQVYFAGDRQGGQNGAGWLARYDRREEAKKRGGTRANRGISKFTSDTTKNDFKFQGEVFHDMPTQCYAYEYPNRTPSIRVLYLPYVPPGSGIKLSGKDKKPIYFNTREYGSPAGAAEAAKQWCDEHLNEFGQVKAG